MLYFICALSCGRKICRWLQTQWICLMCTNISVIMQKSNVLCYYETHKLVHITRLSATIRTRQMLTEVRRWRAIERGVESRAILNYGNPFRWFWWWIIEKRRYLFTNMCILALDQGVWIHQGRMAIFCIHDWILFWIQRNRLPFKRQS